MKIAKIALLLCIISNGAYAEALAEPTDELLYTLKDSLVKVITATKSGGHGFGTGVAISKDHVVTNCHVLSNASGIGISRWGVEYTPVSLQADWRHDICILKFEWADLKPVKIADSDILQYEQAIISISMPSDSPAPYVALSAVKALYPMDDGEVIRTQAAFAIGASGSPIFNYAGSLVGISTFKSPGRNAYYYNMPVKWVKELLLTQPSQFNSTHALPFWDAPDNLRPFFMQIVLPYQNNNGEDMHKIALNWTAQEPNNVEAWYYLGVAEKLIGEKVSAHAHLQKALTLQHNHPASLQALALMAHSEGNNIEFEQMRLALKTISPEALENLELTLATPH